MSFKIDSQLSENQIESDVSSYLGYITPIWSRKRFRLISVDEQLTGADKLFNRFVPIYLQFKVSQGLNPNATIVQRALNKPLANIITYRKNNALSGNPILYFPLRRQAKTAIDLQHNILFKLNDPPLQYSLYIAPLTLEIAEYDKLLDAGWFMRFFPLNPFSQREFEIHDTGLRSNLILGLNPFLKHHVSIPPHTLVNTHNHHYSYSMSAGDVAWHGGKVFNDDFRLSNQLLKIYNNSYFRDDFGMTLERFGSFIEKFNNEHEIIDYAITKSSFADRSFSQILDFSNSLKDKYNIKLLFLTLE